MKQSRRDFLATTGTAAGLLILPSGTFGATAVSPSNKLNIAFIGMGSRVKILLKNIISLQHNIIAICDVDENQIANIRKKHVQHLDKANIYTDYRKLFETEKTLDAVVIATPDHWHKSICDMAFDAGVHIFCEKPLTHTIGEARALRERSRQSKFITQMGNQGSASSNMRRSIEIVESGILGQITDIYVWHCSNPWPGDIANIDQADPVPAGLDWGFWCGPAKLRPYKSEIYHPKKWRGWFDYGNGFVGDFCCHAFNMPTRALQLEYPDRIDIKGTKLGHACFPESSRIQYHFASRGNLDPLTIHLYDGGMYPENGELDCLLPTFGKRPRVGCLLKGEKGHLSAGLWNTDCYIKMNDEKRFAGANKHELAKTVPIHLPRVSNHMQEWTDAISGGPKPFSDFDTGGHLTEIGLAGIVALRMQKNIEWDGQNMKVPGMPEADKFIHSTNRTSWS